MAETFGPFEAYTEVSTSRGVFGLQPGQVLKVTKAGVAIESNLEANPEPDAPVAADSDGGTDDGEKGTPEQGSSEDSPAAPPKVGAGSGQKAWLDYARALGHEVAADAKKADLIALVEG